MRPLIINKLYEKSGIDHRQIFDELLKKELVKYVKKTCYCRISMREFVEAPRKIYEEVKADGRLIEGKSFRELKKIALNQESYRNSVRIDSC
jgi:hypothetical protein